MFPSGGVGPLRRGDAAARIDLHAEAAKHLGITPRTLYRFIDEGQIPGYRFGRVIRLKQQDVDAFIESSRIAPGTLEHLYPEVVGSGDKGERED